MNLSICGADTVNDHRTSNLTHILSVANPNAPVIKPNWFNGEHLVLYFGDVVSEADATQCNTTAPTIDNVRQATEFIVRAWCHSGRVLVHCDYGASRSPALAYVALAMEMGRGMEIRALHTIQHLRPEAVPNKLVVLLGDELLNRGGALYAPVKKMYVALDDEINNSK